MKGEALDVLSLAVEESDNTFQDPVLTGITLDLKRDPKTQEPRTENFLYGSVRQGRPYLREAERNVSTALRHLFN